MGQGAFGIVYKGTDAMKITIAAKRIDGKAHPRILNQDLDRLMKLDHPNVMKILDVHVEKRLIPCLGDDAILRTWRFETISLQMKTCCQMKQR